MATLFGTDDGGLREEGIDARDRGLGIMQLLLMDQRHVFNGQINSVQSQKFLFSMQ